MSKSKDPSPTKVERTGQNSFVTRMEDGSSFHGKTDPKKFNSKGWGKLGTMKERGGATFISDTIKAGNMMTNAYRRRMGIEQDPDLPDYQDTVE